MLNIQMKEVNLIYLHFIILGNYFEFMSKKLSIFLLSGLVFLVPSSVFALGSIELDSYEDTINSSDSFFIFGTISEVSSFKPLELAVIDPDGQLIYNHQVTFDENGNFKKLIQRPLPSFKAGMHTVIASHVDLDQTAELTFNVVGQPSQSPPQIPQDTSVPSPINEGEQMGTPKVETLTGFSISANAIEGSSLITIVGNTRTQSGDVTFTVTSPNGNLISVGQATPVGGEFTIEIITGGPLWEQDGFYTVTAHQGPSSELTDSVSVEIKGGAVIPEFGHIVMIVMSVAISAAIILSARYSKLAGYRIGI